jgi:hypothetical protein
MLLKTHSNRNKLIFFLCLVLNSLLVFFLLLKKVYLNSDTLFLEEFTSSIINNGVASVSDWRITPAPAYIPDVISYILGQYLLRDPTSRIAFVSLVQALILLYLIFRIARLYTVQQKLEFKLALILIWTFTSILILRTDAWIYFYSTNNHFASVLATLLVYEFSWKFITENRLRYLALLAIVTYLATISSAATTISVTLPVVLMFTSVAIVPDVQLFGHRRWRLNSLLVSGAILLGFYCSRTLKIPIESSMPERGQFAFSIDQAVNSFGMLTQTLLTLVNSENSSKLLLSVFSVICIGLALAHQSAHSLNGEARYSQSSENHTDLLFRFGIQMGLVGLGVGIVGAVISGGWVDTYGYRYVIGPIILIECTLILRYLDSLMAWAKGTLTISSLSISCLMILGFAAATLPKVEMGRNTSGGEITRSVSVVVDCVKKANASGENLRYGVSDYWVARQTNVASSGTVNLSPVLDDLSPFYYMTSKSNFDLGDKNFNFIVVRTELDPGQFTFTRQNLSRSISSPTRYIYCTDKFGIEVFDNNELNNVLKQKFEHLQTS